MTDPAPIAPQIPGIALEEMISRTNLSEVWKGLRAFDNAAVAVKFALTPGGAAALQPEADTVRALQAGAVWGIVGAEYVHEPVPHLVLPWKGRQTFRGVLEAIRTGDDRARATRILLQVVDTVAAVQREGFLHGDLKPENILVDDSGQPWLTDFGMARVIHTARLDDRVSRSLSQTEGGWGGTLHYLPPEGLQGDPPAPSWDVYAIGVMLHEILLGARPDRAATPEALRAVLPAAVVDLLLGALAYSPEDRTPNVPLLLSLIDPLKSELTLTGPARRVRRFGRLALTALAAFFVAFRYSFVFAILSGYAAILVLAALGYPGFMVILALAAGFHVLVRWEGPETVEEANLRRSGIVVKAQPAPKQRVVRKKRQM